MIQPDNGIYYFLGNITSHVLHALPLYEKLGGTFVTTSKAARVALEDYGLSVVCIDDVPHVWRWQGKRPHKIIEYTSLDARFKKTVDFLNAHAKVVIFYELFDFSTDLVLDKPKKVFLTHGNMLKNYFKMHPRRLEIIKQYDHMAALGPFMKQEFVRSGIDESKLVDIGIARTDEVVALGGKISISDKLKRIGVPTHRPVVSYLPTFWGDSSVENLGVEIISQITDNYTVLFRPHPQTPKKIIRKYKPLFSRENVFYIPEAGASSPSLLDVYAASSAFIGDVSSVMLEATLLNKPLVFAQPDSSSNIEPHNQLQEIQAYCDVVSRENVKNIESLLTASLKKGIDSDIWQSSKDASFFHHDGTSVDSITRFIGSIL